MTTGFIHPAPERWHRIGRIAAGYCARGAFTRAAVLLVVIALLPASQGVSARSGDRTLDDIRAVVNESVVLGSDVRDAMTFFRQQARSNGQSLPDDSALVRTVLDELINRELREQAAARAGIAVDPGAINRAIDDIARDNNLSTLQFRDALAAQGISYEAFRENLSNQLLMQRLVEREVQNRIHISGQEIDDFLAANDAQQQRYRLGHILVAVPSAADDAELEAANQRAERILERLDNGDAFAEVAAAESDGTRALQGGDLGWRTLPELPEFLVPAVSEMAVGDVSEPLRSSNGLHIVTLVDQESRNTGEAEETLARHVFLAGTDASTGKRMRELRERIVAGADFADIAREFSEDPNSADEGGELPWFRRGEMPEELEAAAASLDAGELSPVFRTRFGWHVLELIDRRRNTLDERELRERARFALRQRKIEQETIRWQQQLRDEAYIEIRS